MPKRKKTPSFSLSEGSNDEPIYEAAPRKKRRPDPSDQCHELYETIRNFKTDEGRVLCESFIRAPKRRNLPDYYELVSNPIDMLKIQQKIKTEEYEDVDQMTVDVELMISNAKAYYNKDTQEYKDACDLWDLFVEAKQQLVADDVCLRTSPDNSDYKGKIILKMGKLARRAAAAESLHYSKDADEDDDSISTNQDSVEDDGSLEELFAAVMTATDSDGRQYSAGFQLLPSKKAYPEYYDIIESPIDLKTIAMRMQQGDYSSLSELEKDLLLMTKNACTFNEPGSLIYKDARALKKIIQNKKLEIEHSRTIAGKSSERIRSRRKGGPVGLSATVAALQYEEEASTESEEDVSEVEEEEDEDEEMNEDESVFCQPIGQLYESIRNYTNSQGYHLSEPFLRLPSKHFYPDYYKEIHNPISLSQIKTKIMRNGYTSLSDVSSDFKVMFDNAKQYNRPDSRLYKDAVKLYKVMQAKLTELLEFEEDELSEDEEEKLRKVKPKFKIPVKSRFSDNDLKKRLRALHRSLLDYIDEENRQIISVFMEKPSKKLYPDYYRIIPEPIDMVTIDSNIKNDKYSCEEELIADFKLMFSNCRQYNEEGSTIYKDADVLEKVLYAKMKEVGLTNTDFSKVKSRKFKKKSVQHHHKLVTLYETIRDYKDNKGRQISSIFMKLPSKLEYPDYYEVIKRPVDLEKIYSKLRSYQYENLDELLCDFVLMFDNACKYNEPDSQIYKDALTLHRLSLQTKLQLQEDEEAVPDVKLAVQEILMSLFISTYNHQDAEGRCYSDSLSELPEYDDTLEGKKIPGFSLDLIKRHLDRGVYKRLDLFQQDVFSALDRARRLSRSDSQVFEDSIEMQSFFIKQRDEICRNDHRMLTSTAVSYTLNQFLCEVEQLKREKYCREIKDDDGDSMKSEDQDRVGPGGATISYNQEIYQEGDFVYIEPKEFGVDPHVIQIERLFTDEKGEQMMYGRWFYKPNETYHLPTRKFLEREVFKSDVHTTMPLSSIVGRCCVLFVKDFFRNRPEGFDDSLVYVCEFRYASKSRAFTKLKTNTITQRCPQIKLVPRDTPLEPKRVASVFRNCTDKQSLDMLTLEELDSRIVNKPRPNVQQLKISSDASNVFYEQFNTQGISMKTGDCVYVRSENGKQLIAQIDSMWVDKEGNPYFHGPWFVTPQEIPHPPTKMFYKQEVFLSSIEDTNPLLAVTGKCCVLEYKDYVSKRPTELPEEDVFMCESMYEESKRQIRKLVKEKLKEYTHNDPVLPDEFYHFRKVFAPQKEPSPHLPKISPDIETEDSLDGPPLSVSSTETPIAPVITPTPGKKLKVVGVKKMVTGYILFSSEIRKTVVAKNPDATFGEISRIVGTEWRNLPDSVKKDYEERAQKMNEETVAQKEAQEKAHAAQLADLPPGSPASVLGTDGVYDCHWEGCSSQFEDLADFADHLINENNGHVFTSYASSDPSFQCLWKSCGRIKKNMAPFPNIQRLVRHVREVHIQKAVTKPADKNKSYIPSKKNSVSTPQSVKPNPVVKTNGAVAVCDPSFLDITPMLTSLLNPGGALTTPQVNPQVPKPNEPIFVSVPARPQRLLHSEAYIRYIENLNLETKHISDWEKSLASSKESTAVPDVSKLPTQWLTNGTANFTDVTSALWALRDYMIKDALGLVRVL